MSNDEVRTAGPLERLVSLQPAKLAGRCADGMERGQGTKVHALTNARRNVAFGDVHGDALCGAKPGRRSVGWTALDGHAVTCPRCLRKMQANTALTGRAPKEDV